MTDYGFKGSQSGYDVDTATDDQLAFSSKFNMFKASVVGTVNVVVPANSMVTQNVAHGFSYKPGYNFFYQIDASGTEYSANDNTTLPLPTNQIISTKLFDCLVYVNNTNLVISVGNSSLTTQYTVYVKYYLYKDQVE